MSSSSYSTESIAAQLNWAKAQLSDSDSATLDARVLLCHVLDKSASYLMTWPEKALTSEQLSEFQQLIQRRCDGQPVAHLIGYRDFWSLRLRVSADTLIPRPETELLVETALELGPTGAAKVLDLGTGTGAIALALASERKDWQVFGADFKAEAVILAQANASDNGLSRVEFRQSDWFTQFAGERFDLIVTNPPYVEADSPYLQQGDVRFEPLSALTSGQDGLDDIRLIVTNAPEHMNPDAWLMIEHGYEQGEAVANLLRQRGFEQVRVCQDLAGLDRITLGCWKGC